MTASRAATAITLCSATLGEDDICEPPLGPLYIAAALEEAGVTVDFRDFQLDPGAHGLSGDRLTAYLADHAPIVAISCFVDMLPAVVDATRQLHAERPDTLFVLGGPGPTASAARILEEYPWITAVVRGEGEETTQEWVNVLRDGREVPVPGMVYRGQDGLRDGGDRPRNRSIDNLPLPAYHLLDWSHYSHARVITTRGCSYRCSFCDVTALWDNRSIYRSLDATIAELRTITEVYGKSAISVVDDTFVLNRNRVRNFCRLLLEQNMHLQWGCFGRINLMTEDLIEAMSAAGCRAIFYGIDSGSQAVLDRTVKRVRAEDVLPVLELSARYFDKIEASFIWGYPFETLDDFKRTLDLAGEASMLAPRVNVQLHMLSPLPLSPIYREFGGTLCSPEPEDRAWLLLPALLLDERAAALRGIVSSAPDIYPGFYSFPTPAKEAKRKLLEQTMSALHRTVGSTLFDRSVGALLKHDDPGLERALLAAQDDTCNRIGTGLALGLFRRTRRRASTDPPPFTGQRGPAMVRERPETKSAPAWPSVRP
jgi:anaerobic magnesium-protoporphyrin IX monomethyl ester cyclase